MTESISDRWSQLRVFVLSFEQYEALIGAFGDHDVNVPGVADLHPENCIWPFDTFGIIVEASGDTSSGGTRHVVAAQGGHLETHAFVAGMPRAYLSAQINESLPGKVVVSASKELLEQKESTEFAAQLSLFLAIRLAECLLHAHCSVIETEETLTRQQRRLANRKGGGVPKATYSIVLKPGTTIERVLDDVEKNKNLKKGFPKRRHPVRGFIRKHPITKQRTVPVRPQIRGGKSGAGPGYILKHLIREDSWHRDA